MTDADRRVSGRDIAIVGIGAIFPGAPDAQTFWRNIVDGVDAITAAPASRLDPVYYRFDGPSGSDRLYCRRGGFVDSHALIDPAAFGIMPVAAEGAEPDQMLALRVATEAIADAGGEDCLGDRSKVGIVLGRGGYQSPAGARLETRVRTSHQLVATLRDLMPDIAEDRLVQVREAFQAKLGPERPEAAIGLVPNLAASRVANRLDLQGPAYTVDAACASSLLAIDHAATELASGRCDVVLAGGTHHTHDILMWSVFTQLGALSRRQSIRPFHRGADGMLIGEGTGVVVLKRLADAERAGDRIYAVIRGCGISSDGRASTLMAPRSAGQVLALRRAWQAAGLDPATPGSIGLLEAHGTATPAGDEAELRSLHEVFGTDRALGEIGIGSVKSMIGHAMPAAGIAGLIKAVRAVHEGVLPPTLHCEEPLAAFAESRFAPVTRVQEWTGTGPRRAGVDAFGFGGINAHVVVEQAPGAAAVEPVFRPKQVGKHERVLLLSGSNTEELARGLDREDVLFRDDAASMLSHGPCRLAIVAPTAERISLARKIVARGTPWNGRNDVWFWPAPLVHGADQVAFLFPGLEPDVRAGVEDVAAHFGLAATELRGSDDFVEQAVDVIAVGRLLAAALGELGISAGVLAGHSLGEWTAMIVGGIFDRSATDELIASLGPGAAIPDLVYAALGCSVDQAETALEGISEVVVSHDNCPHQTIICGRPNAVDVALERLRRGGVLCQVIPVRTGFHSPMLAPYLEPVHKTLADLRQQRPEISVWSATAVEQFPEEPERVNELVIRHLLEPVRFRKLTERLHENGIRAFVQVGQGSLPGFVEDTLRGRDHLVVTASQEGRDGVAQLRRVAVALWAAGLSPRIDRLAPVSGRESRSSPTISATTMHLQLGNPLIRLDGDIEPLTFATATTAGRDPVLAELDLVLASMTADAHTVVDAWRVGRSAIPAGRTNGRQPQSHVSAPPAPRESTTTQEYSLASMPELIDHSLRPVPEGWPDPSDGFPVVPLTVMLELMADAARALRPGRVLVGFDGVRALRWLPVAPPTKATTRAVVESIDVDGVDRVAVTIEGHSSGTVLLAATHRDAPSASLEPLTDERPPTVDVPAIYTDRYMFHGPRFAGIHAMSAMASNGLRGVIENLPTRGALLDAAGQLIGHWSHISLDVDKLVLPTGFASIDLYGPHPKVGGRLTQTVWIREITATDVRADAELVDEFGCVWARIGNWTVRRFACRTDAWPMILRPEKEALSHEQPGGWQLVRERWPDTGSRELWMRSYLCAAERAAYDGLNPMRQRQWLLGRMAAKDAVRRWLWAQGNGPVHPCEITIGEDATGRPVARGRPIPRQLSLSFAHTAARGRTPGLAVAIAGPHPVAVHIESFSTDDDVRSARFRAASAVVAELVDDATQVIATAEYPSGEDISVTVGSGSRAWHIPTRLVVEGDSSHIVAWSGSFAAEQEGKDDGRR